LIVHDVAVGEGRMVVSRQRLDRVFSASVYMAYQNRLSQWSRFDRKLNWDGTN